MKKTLIILLLGIVIGAVGWHFYQRTFAPTVTQRAEALGERTREAAAETKKAAVSSTKELGEHIEDAAIVALIKGKYVMDRDLSALAITVDCTNGFVVLKGSVATPELAA